MRRGRRVILLSSGLAARSGLFRVVGLQVLDDVQDRVLGLGQQQRLHQVDEQRVDALLVQVVLQLLLHALGVRHAAVSAAGVCLGSERIAPCWFVLSALN
jgi:hypothetical protein